jgi:hypothetical protein
LNAQEYKSFTIENISEEMIWYTVYKTFQVLKLLLSSIYKNTGTGKTEYCIEK